MDSTIRKPSAWIPIVMSLLVLGTMLISFAISGLPARQPDEETAAHLFQIWLVIEVLLVSFFAIKWLPQRPKPALVVLAIQIISALAACAPVFYLGL
jgi:hypothetical protein